MTVEDAKQYALQGQRFEPLFQALENEEARRMFKAWWLYEPRVPVHRSFPQGRRPGQPQIPSGNPCKKCGAGLVWGGKCQYCPLGCGSEGECS